jgi:hypothetical protein
VTEEELKKHEQAEVQKQAAALAANIPEEDAQPERCIRCDHPIGQKVLEPSETDKREYVRRLLSNETFKKTYPMFDGALTLQFETLSSREAQILERFVDEINATRDPAQARSETLRLRAVLNVRKIGDKELLRTELSPTTKVEEVLGEWDVRFGDCSEDMIVIIIRVLVQFTQYMNILANSAFDKNFWKGAGLG